MSTFIVRHYAEPANKSSTPSSSVRVFNTHDSLSVVSSLADGSAFGASNAIIPRYTFPYASAIPHLSGGAKSYPLWWSTGWPV